MDLESKEFKIALKEIPKEYKLNEQKVFITKKEIKKKKMIVPKKKPKKKNITKKYNSK